MICRVIIIAGGTRMYVFLYPYFIAGFLCNKCGVIRKYKIFQEKMNNDLISFFVIGIIFFIFLVFYDYNSYIYTSKISLLGGNGMVCQLGIDLYRWIIGFIGSLAIIFLCKLLYDRFNGKMIKVVVYLGKISLGIYILNSYVNNNIMLKFTKNFKPNVLIWIAETGISLVLYVATVEVIKRIPFANKLLLGGR